MKIQIQIQIQIQVELQIHFGQLLTDEHHRVGQFGPARLGRLMCGTFFDGYKYKYNYKYKYKYI